ncbi:hypothetical protein LCGC14_2499240, partial [marine sediment metagenome]
MARAWLGEVTPPMPTLRPIRHH